MPRKVYLAGLILSGLAGCSPAAGIGSMVQIFDADGGAVDGGARSDASSASDAGAALDSSGSDASLVADAGSVEDGGAASDATARADGGDAGALHALSDEFDDPTTLSSFLDLYPQRHDSLSIAAGRLAITPVAMPYNHWYSDSVGPALLKTVSGDFVVEVQVAVGRRGDPSMAPRGMFNAAGLLLRDPASTQRQASWLMYNLGHQISSVAREVKTTRPAALGQPLSTLYLIDTPGAVLSGRLRVCRLGATFRFFHLHPGEAAWTEEAFDANTIPRGNGNAEPTPGVTPGGTIRFERPDLPATLQVGLLAGNWDAPLETQASFDWLRFGPATQLADCTGPL